MKKTWIWGLLPSIIVFAMLMQGCGQNKALTPSAGSFGEAAGSLPQLSGSNKEVAITEPEPATSEPDVTAEASREITEEKAGAKAKEEDTKTEGKKEASLEEKKEDSSSKPASVKSENLEILAETKKDGRTNSTDGKVPAKEQTQAEALKSPESPKSQSSPKDENRADSKAASDKTSATVASSKPPTSKENKSASGGKGKTGTQPIGWSQFFDGDDQTTPSEAFWDLSGSTVTIKGFMGEVLSFENNWFLLIPEPGAECPFDNGDETYWNKIMIVFVPEDVKLRYKSEPLEITGRLDVGIKIDESGYKTMFRLYDASFKEIKE